jgi:hypothetical protein
MIGLTVRAAHGRAFKTGGGSGLVLCAKVKGKTCPSSFSSSFTHSSLGHIQEDGF